MPINKQSSLYGKVKTKYFDEDSFRYPSQNICGDEFFHEYFQFELFILAQNFLSTLQAAHHRSEMAVLRVALQESSRFELSSSRV